MPRLHALRRHGGITNPWQGPSGSHPVLGCSQLSVNEVFLPACPRGTIPSHLLLLAALPEAILTLLKLPRKAELHFQTPSLPERRPTWVSKPT